MKYRAILSLVTLLAFLSLGFTWQYTRYENLANPTEYLFSFPADRVKEALRLWKKGPGRTGILGGGFVSGDKFAISTPQGYYTERYWTGPRENVGINPSEPETGWIGTIEAVFDVLIIPEGEKCRVKVVPYNFQQHVGRTYTLVPHFHKTGKYKRVKSDTYFEYLFLTELGVILGEKNMPALKGRSDGDEWDGHKLPGNSGESKGP